LFLCHHPLSALCLLPSHLFFLSLTLFFLFSPPLFTFFFFNDPPPTEIYTLSLHDALPISLGRSCRSSVTTMTSTWICAMPSKTSSAASSRTRTPTRSSLPWACGGAVTTVTSPTAWAAPSPPAPPVHACGW